MNVPLCILILFPTKSPVWAFLLLPTKFPQITVVAPTDQSELTYTKDEGSAFALSIWPLCCLLPFFSPIICLILHCSGYVWSWRSSSRRGWPSAVPGIDLWFGCESTWELVITGQQSQSQVCEEGRSFPAGRIFKHWKPLFHLAERGFWCFLEIIWQNNHL